MIIFRGIAYYFNGQSLLYSLYIIFGFILSHYSHIYVYKIRGGKSLMTWLRLFNLTENEPSIKTVYILCLALVLIIFSMTQLTIPYIEKASSLSVFKVGMIYSLIFLILSQLISSSVMRLSYEFLICSILLVGILLTKVFLKSNQISIERYQELWDLLKFITPLFVGLPIILGSVGFITSFYQTEQSVIRLQLYRHIAMTIYFIIGTFCFIIYPIISKILFVREKIL
jgi:hypothetical protein